MIRFADYTPDQPGYFSSGAPNIKNVIPTPSGYAPVPGFVAFSAALSSAPKGYFTHVSDDGSVTTFAATASGLYRLDTSDKTWDDVSRGTAYTGAGEAGWSFASFGQIVIATNGVDEVQAFTVGTSSTFDDLAGNPPKAKWVTVVGDYVVLYGMSDYPSRLQWSGTNDATSWTIGENNCDYQDFPTGGEIKYVTPIGDNGIVLQRYKTRVMGADPDLIWRFQEFEQRGAMGHNSCVPLGAVLYYLSDDGFYALSPGNVSQPIGFGKVDTTFRRRTASISNVELIVASADPVSQSVIWVYPTGEDGDIDGALSYSWKLQKWAELDLGTLTFLTRSITASVTLEDIGALYATLEDVPVSLDSARWLGGKPIFAGFDSSFRLGLFDGPNLEATLETADLSFQEGRKAIVRGFRFITDATDATAQLGTRQSWEGGITWSSVLNKSSRTSRYSAKASGFTHRFRAIIPAGSVWTGISGIESVESAITGSR